MSSTTKSMFCVACVFGFATSAMVFGHEFDPNEPADGPRVQVQRDANGVQVEVQRGQAQPAQQGEQLGRVDDATSDMVVRASQLTGMNVYNPAGKHIGSIEDLVLDAKSGKVRYAALSFGGFLGFGEKLFAIPWNSIECRRGDSANEHRLVLDVNEEMLKEAPGFASDNWPDFGDKRITERFDNYYRTRR